MWWYPYFLFVKFITKLRCMLRREVGEKERKGYAEVKRKTGGKNVHTFYLFIQICATKFKNTSPNSSFVNENIFL